MANNGLKCRFLKTQKAEWFKGQTRTQIAQLLSN